MNKQYADAAAYEKKLQKMGKQMTVKDLKEKLETLPEDTKIFFVTSRTANLTEDFCAAGGLIYLEIMEEGGTKAVYITP